MLALGGQLETVVVVYSYIQRSSMPTVEPTLEMVENRSEVIWAIRSRYPLLLDIDIENVLIMLERLDKVRHKELNAQVDADREPDEEIPVWPPYEC